MHSFEGKFAHVSDSEDGGFATSELLSSKYHTIGEFQRLDLGGRLSIFHSNVNGLESKCDTLDAFLHGASSPLDIIAITETSEQNVSNVSKQGYNLYHAPARSSKGGVCVYVSEKYDVFGRADLGVHNDHFQSVWSEIKNKDSKNIIFGCMYRSPNKKYDVVDFLVHLDSILKKISKENKEIYLCGDFNIDLLKIDKGSHFLDFYNVLSSYGLLPSIIHPSRVVEDQRPSLIDNIFTNNFGDEIVSGNIYLALSEHFSQFASIKRGRVDLKDVVMFGRDYSKFKDSSFRDDVSIQAWGVVSSDSNVLTADFLWRLDGCVERHAPIKKLNKKQIKRRLNPWMTTEIIKLIGLRDRLFERKKREPGNSSVGGAYKKVRNKVNREIKKSKDSYHKAYFESHSNDIKKTWEGIRKIINPGKPVGYGISQLNINGNIIDDSRDIANQVNNFLLAWGQIRRRLFQNLVIGLPGNS